MPNSLQEGLNIYASNANAVKGKWENGIAWCKSGKVGEELGAGGLAGRGVRSHIR